MNTNETSKYGGVKDNITSWKLNVGLVWNNELIYNDTILYVPIESLGRSLIEFKLNTPNILWSKLPFILGIYISVTVCICIHLIINSLY